MSQTQPTPVQFKDREWFFLDDLITFDQAYFYGCLRYHRQALQRIPQDHWMFVKMVKGHLEDSHEGYARAKALVTKTWATNNVPNLMMDQRPRNGLMMAPPLLELKESEMFRSVNGVIVHVEVRGTRTEDTIFFKCSDVASLFEMEHLESNVARDYIRFKHFQLFLPEHDRPIDGRNPVAVPKQQGIPFFTYAGLIEVIYRSRSGVAHRFKDSFMKQVETILNQERTLTLIEPPKRPQPTSLDMFDFIKDRHPALQNDMIQPWFKQVWLPLCMKQIEPQMSGTQMGTRHGVEAGSPTHLGRRDGVEAMQRTHLGTRHGVEAGSPTHLGRRDGVEAMQRTQMGALDLVVTDAVFEFLGYDGDAHNRTQKFKELLVRNEIPFKEVSFDQGKDNQFISEEAKSIGPNNIERKRWIVMDNRSFRKAVLKLNTKRANEIIDYYMNLEEFAVDYGMHWAQMKSDAQLADAMAQLEIKDKKIDEAQKKLREETERSKRIMTRSLAFQQATKKVEAHEYIYIATTDHYQNTFKYKVGGVQSFELLKSRLCQYNSGKSDSDLHYFVYVRKTVNYKIIEQTMFTTLSAFRENQDKELYFMCFKWLKIVLERIIDGSDDVLTFINDNRTQMAQELHDCSPRIEPPVHLEEVKITITKAGDQPVVMSSFDSDVVASITDALKSFSPDTNVVHRKQFETHLEDVQPDVLKTTKKRTLWDAVKHVGKSLNPHWLYKY